MTGQQLVDRCEERFGDTGNLIVSETDWLAYLNAAYRAFYRRRKEAFSSSVTATIPAGGRAVSIAAQTDAVQRGIVAVSLTGPPEIPLEPQPETLPQRFIQHWTDRPSAPMYWKLNGSRLTVLPAWAAGGSVTIYYPEVPTALGLASVPLVPETFHDALVSGAVAQAYLDDGNHEASDRYQAEFEAMRQAYEAELAQEGQSQ